MNRRMRSMVIRNNTRSRGGGELHVVGVDGNGATIRDGFSSLQVAGDLDIHALLNLPDWTPAFVGNIIGMWGAIGNRGYALAIDTTGAIRLRVTVDGSTIRTVTSSASVPFTTGLGWVRASRVADTGEVTFYTAGYDSGSHAPTGWTQLGNVMPSVVGDVFPSTAPPEFGNIIGFTGDPLNGGIRRVMIFGDESLKMDVDFSRAGIGLDGFSTPGGHKIHLVRSGNPSAEVVLQ